MKRRILVILTCALALTACQSVKSAARVKKPAAASTLRLTLLPQTAPQPQKPTQVDAKLTRIKDRSRVLPQELSAPGLRLLAIDSNYNDFQLITPSEGALPGLFHFTFTPASSQAYRLWGDVEMDEGKLHLHEFPFADIGGKSGRSFPRQEKLEIGDYRLKLSEPLVKFGETALTVSRGETEFPVTEVFGFFDDYRTVLHVVPASGETPRISPQQQGFIKLLLRISDSGKEQLLPFVVEVKKE
ncbi:MAG: hypothetical protein EBV03_09265 [Proteobacteria bacterium]|nr:hypothetical protein [Pseudomonadota bacterium]